jgi:hypothetical protein
MESPSIQVQPVAAPITWASYVLVAAGLLLVLMLHMLPALIAGLLVFELVQSIAPFR